MSSKRKLSHPADPAVVKRQRGAFAGDDAQRTPRQRMMGSVAQPRGPPDADALKAISAELAAALADAITVEADAFSLERFCRRHGISLAMYYKIASQGLTPRTFNIGTRVLVSEESAAAWRREREDAAVAETTNRTAEREPA